MQKSSKYWQKLFLICTAIILLPIGLTYGFVPEQTLHYLYGIDVTVNSINLVHILRALMGLYIGMLIFWLIGAFNEKLRIPALYSLTVFMFSVAMGRIFSLCFDGFPHWIFLFFLSGEFAMGFTGVYLLSKDRKDR